MKVGVLGYPGVGKSTLFSALTGFDLTVAPTKKRRAVAEVLDRRLDHLRSVFSPRKFSRARFEIEECPPLPSANTKARGEVISLLREPDVFLLVIGQFAQSMMTLDQSIHSAAAQVQSLHADLLLLDLEAVEQRLERLTNRAKRGTTDEMKREISHLEVILAGLDDDGAVVVSTDRDHRRLLSELRLFTLKPTIAVFNVDEDAESTGHLLAATNGRAAIICAPIEFEIAQMDDEDKRPFLDEYGLDVPASERLTRLAYEALDLISFFTVGDDEVRAWPIRRGSDALTAAGKVHTDLARGFIRAEVTPYVRVSEATNAREFKEMGAADLRGKDYVVEDGDTINIRFSL